MIFVTVGTHEQQFNRLVKYMDGLRLEEEVIIQSGYSDYVPKYCKYEKMLPYQKMVELVEKARIVVTHGGPSSIMLPPQMGKMPIVVPRQKEYGEHVNDHQLEFVRKISESIDIIPVYDIQDLGEIIRRYESIAAGRVKLKTNNAEFNRKLEDLVDRLFQ